MLINNLITILKVLIQHQPLLHPIRIHIHPPPPIKYRIRIMNYPVVIRTDNHLIPGIIIQALYKVIDVVRFRDMRTKLLSDQLPTQLTAISIKKLQIFADQTVQLSNFDQTLIDLNAGTLIALLIIELCFNEKFLFS